MTPAWAHALAVPEKFAAALAAATREIGARSPAPRNFPFFGLDLPPGCGERLLDRLCEPGIFRVYERVLDLSSGLGGQARWLARRHGCRVVAAARDSSSARASRLLTRRAHLEKQVVQVASSLSSLPFPDGEFTHVWAIGSLSSAVDPGAAILDEAWRVLRAAGHLAIQEWLAATEAEERVEALEAAGFVDVRRAPAGELREAESTVAGLARGRTLARLRSLSAAAHEEIERTAAALEAEGDAARSGRLRLFQIVASKPSW